jgi:hypothetical protein
MPCLLLINILKREYKNVLNRFRSTFNLDMTSRGRGVSVILEMEQEQPF